MGFLYDSTQHSLNVKSSEKDNLFATLTAFSQGKCIPPSYEKLMQYRYIKKNMNGNYVFECELTKELVELLKDVE